MTKSLTEEKTQLSLAPAFFSWQAKVGRATGFCVFAFFAIRQISFYPGTDAPWNRLINWALIQFLFLLFLNAYYIRKPALALANHWKEILLPLICAPLPILLSMIHNEVAQGWLRNFSAQPWAWFWFRPHFSFSHAGNVVLLIGDTLTVMGMWKLGGSFSLFSEAREPVFSGLYRFVRHPLYLGEILSVMSFALYSGSLHYLLGGGLFVLLQIWRAKVEEKKLSSVFPAYENYRKKTPFLIPRIIFRDKVDSGQKGSQ